MTRERLIELCLDARLPARPNLVFQEPYLPFVPGEWNGILVLAESQNLSRRSEAYVAVLTALPPRERVLRLYRHSTGESIGVAPWDDGSLPLALAAALDSDPDAMAVGNAILWSETDAQGNNANPSPELQEASVRLWQNLLPILQPRRVVTAGKLAAGVVSAAIHGLEQAPQHLGLRLPSPRALSPVSGMFSEDDLVARFPEVAAAIRRHPKALAKGNRRNKVYFACHAVSVLGAAPR